MKNIPFPSSCEAARTWATNLHKEKGCTYAEHPYSFHLEQVVEWVRFAYNQGDIRYEAFVTCVQAAWLHDVIEDCGVTYNDVKLKFGQRVAEIVYAVTNEKGRNRQERAKRTYPGIRANNLAVLVKLCDRLANTKYSKETASSMYQKYKDEYPEFRKELKDHYNFYSLWDTLDELSEWKPTICSACGQKIEEKS